MAQLETRHKRACGSAFRRLALIMVLAIVAVAGASLIVAQRLFCKQSQLEAQHRAQSLAAAIAGALRDDWQGHTRTVARNVLQSVIDSDEDIKLIAILDQGGAPVLTYGDSEATAERGAESLVPIFGAPAAQQPGTPRAYARVVAVQGDTRHYFLWQAAWTSTVSAIAVGLAWFSLSGLKRRAGESLSIARSLGAHLRVRGGDEPVRDEFCELGALLHHIVEEREEDDVRREKRSQLQSQDLHAAITDAVKGERDKQRLLEYAEEMVELERERIALEIHDKLNATVVSIKLYAETIAAAASSESPDKVRHCAKQIASIASQFYDNGRAMVRQLRPEALDTLGFGCAVAEMVHSLNEGRSGCVFEFRSDREIVELPRSLSIALYRAVQEALANVVKHAQASSATVSVLNAPPPHHVRIVVDDNGVGIAESTGAGSSGSGLGLIGMRERIQRVGGSLSITSAEHGTCITMLA